MSEARARNSPGTIQEHTGAYCIVYNMYILTVAAYEQLHVIAECWTPESDQWKAALGYMRVYDF